MASILTRNPQIINSYCNSLLYYAARKLFAPQAHYVQERAGYLGREIMMCRGDDIVVGVHP